MTAARSDGCNQLSIQQPRRPALLDARPRRSRARATKSRANRARASRTARTARARRAGDTHDGCRVSDRGRQKIVELADGRVRVRSARARARTRARRWKSRVQAAFGGRRPRAIRGTRDAAPLALPRGGRGRGVVRFRSGRRRDGVRIERMRDGGERGDVETNGRGYRVRCVGGVRTADEDGKANRDVFGASTPVLERTQRDQNNDVGKCGFREINGFGRAHKRWFG